MWTCKYCETEYSFERTTDKANHAKHCDARPDRDKQYKKISTALKARTDELFGPLTEYDVECHNCGETCTVEERPKQHPLKEKYFCSKPCANSEGGKAKAAIHHTDDVAKYTTVCWRHHPKECVVCEEQNIVAVHHYNEDHDDNRPENLVPLCPTHHMYMHSNHKYLIEDQVAEYVKSFTGV